MEGTSRDGEEKSPEGGDRRLVRTLSEVPGANPAMHLRFLQPSCLQRICYPGSVWILASLMDSGLNEKITWGER